jgi:hypothetical protein
MISDKDLHAFVLEGRKEKEKKSTGYFVTQMMKNLRTNCIYIKKEAVT